MRNYNADHKPRNIFLYKLIHPDWFQPFVNIKAHLFYVCLYNNTERVMNAKRLASLVNIIRTLFDFASVYKYGGQGLNVIKQSMKQIFKHSNNLRVIMKCF